MKSSWFATLAVVVVVAVVVVEVVAVAKNRQLDQAVNLSEVYVWPLPESVSHGKIDMKVIMSKVFVLEIQGSYKDTTGILQNGFSRFLDVVKMDHVVGASPSSPLLKGLRINVSSTISEIQYEVDESYKLSVPSPDSKQDSYAEIQAETVFGALHGLQTLSQLCEFDSESEQIQVSKVPWVISDRPRFPYRGLLIDTSRHFLPIRTIYKIIDAMAYSKMNVLHWHIVDQESFPLQIPSFPMLWNGSYSKEERYTMAEAAAIVSYAEKRGINVMVELDVPGHSASWGEGYPQLWPSKDCKQPLDISNEFTFELIEGIISNFSKVFKFKFIHLGADEVNTTCWTTTPRISKWLNDKKMSALDGYRYFVLRVHAIARKFKYEVVNWQEAFDNFKESLSNETVIQNWLPGVDSAAVTAAGFRCIVSNVDDWYLGPIKTPWEKFYMNNPLENIEDPKHKALVMGGEICMWGEKVDASDAEPTIWPRGAAGAEALWTPYEKQAKNTKEVVGRLSRFRCLLDQRGIPAAPLNGLGRAAPKEAGSCYLQ